MQEIREMTSETVHVRGKWVYYKFYRDWRKRNKSSTNKIICVCVCVIAGEGPQVRPQ